MVVSIEKGVNHAMVNYCHSIIECRNLEKENSNRSQYIITILETHLGLFLQKISLICEYLDSQFTVEATGRLLADRPLTKMNVANIHHFLSHHLFIVNICA